jgi:hypothetical protein
LLAIARSAVVRRPPTDARTAAAIGLQVNQVGRARRSAGVRSSRSLPPAGCLEQGRAAEPDGLATLPLLPLMAPSGEALEQAGSPVKMNTQGLVAKIKFEALLGGFLTEINGKYKLRITELTLAPGGHVGEHNHVGPGIRQVTSG